MSRFSETLIKLKEQRADKTVMAIKLNNFLVDTIKLINSEVRRNDCSFEAGAFETQNGSNCISTYVTIGFPKGIFDRSKKFILVIKSGQEGYSIVLNSQLYKESLRTPEDAKDAFFDLLDDIVKDIQE